MSWSWTEEHVDTLRKLWGEGKTAAQIAKELGASVTRNAVIGKAHRLKLSNRVSPIQQNNKKSVRTLEEKPVVRRLSNVEAPVIKVKGIKLADLTEKMCRWPIGDPKEPNFHFCGCSSVSGLPYCVDHAKMAYQAVSRSRALKAKDFANVDEGTKEAASA